MDSCSFYKKGHVRVKLLVISFVVRLLDDLVDGCAPELFWELECHTRFGIDHGYTRRRSC